MKLFFAILAGALLCAGRVAEGSAVKTPNFIVDGPVTELTQEVARRAEDYRRKIAVEWIGRELPQWNIPCLLFVSVEDGSKSWAWTYHFKGEIRGIVIRGTREEIFEHSLPHELTHAVTLSYFGDYIPRWADEGMAVSGECDCPKRLHGRWGNKPLRDLFTTTDYPDDWEPFYGQGYSVTTYITKTYGRPLFFEFIRQGGRQGWEKSCENVLKTKLDDLENDWKQWHTANFANTQAKRD